MELTAETLKLSREQDCVGIVDLLGCVTSTSADTAHPTVGVLDLVEGLPAVI
jgi:hypothetical protein